METQDQRTAISSGHVSHGVHLCHKCGWPFPNPHPSAKHRRAHKKVCGTIEGYKLTESEATHLAISDDEHLSDEDRRTPSPKINDKSLKEPASFKSTRSEDEVFSDAMTEFLDSGLKPGMDEGLVAARKLGKHVQKFQEGDELLNVDTSTDASEPLDDPSMTSQIGDPQLLESAMKSLDATPIGSKSEDYSVVFNEPSGEQLDPIKSETVGAPIAENVNAIGEKVLMSNDRQDICVNENEHSNVNEILSDAVEPSRDIPALQSRISEPDSAKSAVQKGEEKTSSLSQKVDSVEADSKISSSSTLDPDLLEGTRDISGDIILESKSDGADVKTSGPLDLKSNRCQADGKASEVVSVDRKLELSDELETGMGRRDEMGVFLQVSPLQKTATEDIDGRCQNECVELRKTKEEEKADVHLLSVAKDISCLYNAELMIEDYKDYSSLKSNLAVDLGAGDELISFTQDDVKSTLEEHQSRIDAYKPNPSILRRSTVLDASGDNIRKDDAKVPTEGKIDPNGSKVINDEHIGSCESVSAPATLESPILNFEPTNSLSMEDESSQSCKPLAHSYENSIAPCMGEEVGQTIPTIVDTLGDDVRKDDGKVLIEGKIDPDGSKVINDENFGSCGSVSAPATLESLILNFEPTNSLFMEDESSQNSLQQCKPLGNSDNSSFAPCMGEEVRQTITSGGSEIFYDCIIDKTQTSFTAENESREGYLQDEYSANTKIGFGHTDNSFIFEETQTPVSFGGDGQPDFEKYGTKCLDVARYRSKEENEGKLVRITGGGAEDYQTGYSLEVGGNSLHNKARTEVPNVSGSEHTEEDAKDKMVNIEPMHDSSMDVLESTNAAGVDERNCGNVEQVSSVSGKHMDEGSQEKCYKGPTLSESASLPVDLNSGNSATVENSNIVDATSTSGVGSLPLKGEGDDKITKQQDGVTAVDISVASSSRTDSLEANWGSVSVLSIQSESIAVDVEVADSGAPEKSGLQKTKIERNPDKSDTFEPPSFMTLVESGSGFDQKAVSEIDNVQNAQHPKSEALKAGWFPSLNNVVNESQGRKKNEEIIAKVTNWSTGKQHTPLKNLLGEAKSPKTNQMQKDETATHNTAAKVTTVNSILSFETPTDQAGHKEVEKEWNSPARYPVDIKKEKKKGKAYWVPFVCCSSVH